MKRIKKLASLFLAMIMVLAMAVPAMAKEAALTGHEYKAFQVFSGTQNDEDGDAALASIEWGSGVNGDALLAALKADPTIGSVFTDVTTAEGVAKAIETAGWGEDSAQARAFARVAYANKTGDGVTVVNGQTELDAGYYLVVDVTTFDPDDEDTVLNLALLQLTKKGTFEIKNKTDVPEVEKKVQETNDTTGEPFGWQDAADYDIGDDVPFQLTATLPTDYDSYVKYTLTFHDTLSAGLTYNDDADVFVVNGDREIEITDQVTATKANSTLTVAIADLKALTGVTVTKDSKIVVRYTAKLNASAVAGSAGNSNTVTLEYSNDPNNDGTGTPPTGTTPEDKVVVFTYNIVADKVDKDGNALEGAGFTLYKWVKNDDDTEDWVKVGNEITGVTSFEFKGADAGKYKLVETTVPAGYNKADDIIFEVVATYDTTSDDPSVTGLVVKNEAGEVISGENLEFSATVNTGVVNTKVVNQKGSLLPETGGIGTTIFYVVGGILVVAAGILLVTKKRMSVR